MISPLPWSLDEGNPSIIYDADGDVVAEDYKFLHVDDFESICKLINLLGLKKYIKEEEAKTILSKSFYKNQPVGILSMSVKGKK